MTTEDRRDQILDAVLPVISEYGSAVTSKQLADAAEVAEGTLFRVFGDKDTLLRSAFKHGVEASLSLEGLPTDPAATLDQTVERMTFVLVDRFSNVFKLAVALGPLLNDDPRAHDAIFERLRTHIAGLLAPFVDELRVELGAAADALRTLAFAAATGWGQPGGLSIQDASSVVLHGIAAPQAPRKKEEL